MADRFAPSDGRFLGLPTDYIVLDGLSDGAFSRIVLVEIKAGRQRLNVRQSQIRAAVDT